MLHSLYEFNANVLSAYDAFNFSEGELSARFLDQRLIIAHSDATHHPLHQLDALRAVFLPIQGNPLQ